MYVPDAVCDGTASENIQISKVILFPLLVLSYS
jgi:hypothetical protein